LSGPQDFIAVSRERFRARRNNVVQWLNEAPGVQCHMPEGAFYVFASCAGAIGKKTRGGTVIQNDADFAMHLLESQNVAVIHGEAYGMSPCFRISYAASEALLEEGCRRIRLACEELV
jgi:aspartate aminotransferase